MEQRAAGMAAGRIARERHGCVCGARHANFWSCMAVVSSCLQVLLEVPMSAAPVLDLVKDAPPASPTWFGASDSCAAPLAVRGTSDLR